MLNETGLRMFNANPAEDGDVGALNLASLNSRECVEQGPGGAQRTCTWTRKIRSVASIAKTFNTSFSGSAGMAVTVTPATFTINPGEEKTLTIQADLSAAPLEVWSQGEITFTNTAVVPTYSETSPAAPAVPIPDNGYAGGFGGGTQACVAVDTTGDLPVGQLVHGLTVQVAMAHTWLGDLTLKLRSPDGTTLGLMSLAGFAETLDDGTQEDSLESSNLLATFPITFSDSAGTSAEAMGGTLTSAQVVCRDGGTPCSYSPAPGAVAQPPSSLAGFNGGSAIGVWTLCAGDSVGFDTGSLTSLRVDIATAPIETLHMPVAAFGVEPEPDITVAPTSVSASGDVGGPVVTETFEIGNAGFDDLDWNEVPAVGSAPVWEQVEDDLNGIISSNFPGDGGGAFSANDFELEEETTLARIFTPGFDNTAQLGAQPSITWQIYPDAAGEPAGDPETNPGAALWSYTANIGDPEVSIGNDDITLNLVTAAEDVTLPAGTYWLTVFPTYTTPTGQWNWSQGVPAGAVTPLISPVIFGLPDWTPINGPPINTAWTDTAFTLSAAQSCGAPWVSIDPTNGTVAPDGSQEVEVSFDPTGLTEGLHEAIVLHR